MKKLLSITVLSIFAFGVFFNAYSMDTPAVERATKIVIKADLGLGTNTWVFVTVTTPRGEVARGLGAVGPGDVVGKGPSAKGRIMWPALALVERSGEKPLEFFYQQGEKLKINATVKKITGGLSGSLFTKQVIKSYTASPLSFTVGPHKMTFVVKGTKTPNQFVIEQVK